MTGSMNGLPVCDFDEKGQPRLMQDYRQLFQLTGKIAVVLGASSGIGQASAHALGQLGAHVVCADRDGAGARATAEQIADGGGAAEHHVVDAACGGDIVSRVRWPVHTGQLEGINSKIKLIKRQAFGYRDADYFFLKIKAAFPGFREEPKNYWLSLPAAHALRQRPDERVSNKVIRAPTPAARNIDCIGFCRM